MAKRKNRNKYAVQQKRKGSWTRLFLALSLVPMIIGVLLIGAWALDLNIFPDPQSQTLVGLLFIMFGFAVSNALQKKRDNAIGWSLLTLADLVLLLWVDLWAQVIAIVVGLVGLGFVIKTFYIQWRENKKQRN